MSRTRITSLRMEGMSQSFTSHDIIFKDVSLDLPLGEAIAIEGGPGSGKSLLLKIMAGLMEPTSGSVFYNGMELKQLSFEEFTPIRMSTAFSFDDGGLLTNKTLEENLKLALNYHHSWRNERSQQLFEELVGHFEVGHYLAMRPAQLSSSVRKLSGLIRAFLHNAQVLFLDEPSLGIGDKGIKALNFWLEKHRKEGKHDELIVIASSDETFIKGLKATHMKIEGGGLVSVKKFRRETA